MTKPTWDKGPAPDFWMEENKPAGEFYSYVFDSAEPPMCKELHGLLNFLKCLGIVEYGTIYETIDCIRIRVRK